MSNKKTQKVKMVKGAFGIKLPENYRFKLKDKNERKEVLWLIKEGVFKDIRDYEETMTRLLLEP
jgi:hypothetical protein